MLGLNAETEDDVEKSQVSIMGKYLVTAFLLRSDRRQYGELILSLKNDHAKQQNNYPKNLTAMYRLLVLFEPTRISQVSRGGATKV